MPIQAMCPACQAACTVPDALRGKRVRCVGCGHVFTAAVEPPLVEAVEEVLPAEELPPVPRRAEPLIPPPRNRPADLTRPPRQVPLFDAREILTNLILWACVLGGGLIVSVIFLIAVPLMKRSANSNGVSPPPAPTKSTPNKQGRSP
jgi:predicted Zn finger-like uncharacterized protein